MTTVNFAYWLQGFFEITGTNTITEDQVKMIKAHLNMVFIHEIDPSMGDESHQTKLNNAHFGFGPQPAPGYELDNLHGWFDPEKGRPRC